MSKLIGTNPNQVPTNADLGTMAYMDYDAVAPVLIGGRRNLIINGAMRISQRGDYSSATGMTSGNYYLDRWKSSHAQTTTIQQTAYDGERTGMKVVVGTTNATGYVEQYQPLEDYMIVEGKTVTISAKVKSNAKARLYCSGTNGLEGMSEPHSGNGQEEYMTVTFKVSTNNTVLRFYIGFVSSAAGPTSVTAGDYFEVTEYQLELGSVATPFEHRSYGEELALCQRYFYMLDFPTTMAFGFGYRQTTNTARVTTVSPVEMRAQPTLTATATTYVNTGVGSIPFTGKTVVAKDRTNICINGTATGIDNSAATGWGYSGDFYLDAEL